MGAEEPRVGERPEVEVEEPWVGGMANYSQGGPPGAKHQGPGTDRNSCKTERPMGGVDRTNRRSTGMGAAAFARGVRSASYSPLSDGSAVGRRRDCARREAG